jgi:uncharacterized damage-inducible protein DinB
VADHRTPFTVADERTTLHDFLRYLRECVIRKAEGLDDDAVRRSMVPSGTSVLGLVAHLSMVEASWVQVSAGGLQVPVPSGQVGDRSTADVLSEYRRTAERDDELIAAWHDLDALTAEEHHGGRLSLRWVLVHLVEETARHAGHADICRELLDGETGR